MPMNILTIIAIFLLGYCAGLATTYGILHTIRKHVSRGEEQ